MGVEKVWNSLDCPNWAVMIALGWGYKVTDMGFKLVCCPWPSELWLMMGKVYLLLVIAVDAVSGSSYLC